MHKGNLIPIILLGIGLLGDIIAYAKKVRSGNAISEKSKAQAVVGVLTMFLAITALMYPYQWAKLPLALFFPGFILAVTIALAVLVVQALSWSLEVNWSWRKTGLRQTFFVLYACSFVFFSYWLIRELAQFGFWSVALYILAGLEASLLTPVFTRYLAIRYTAPATAD